MEHQQVVVGPARVGHELSSDYHQKPIIDLRFADSTFKEFNTTNTLGAPHSDILDLSFEIPATGPGRHYSLKDMILQVDMQLCMRDGSSIPDGSRIGIHNNILASCFNSCVVKLSKTEVSTRDMYYAHQAYLELMLGSSAEVRENQLSSTCGYTKDVPGEFTSDQHPSYLKRIKRFAKKVTVTKNKKTGLISYHVVWKDTPTRFIGFLHTDLASIETPIPNGVPIHVELRQSRYGQRIFRLSPDDTADYRLSIKQAKLFVKEYCLSVKAAEDFRLKIIKNPAIYNYRELKVSVITIPKGSKSYATTSLNLGAGTLPARIFLVFNESSVFFGDFLRSPFEYKRKFLIPPPQTPQQLRVQNGEHGDRPYPHQRYPQPPQRLGYPHPPPPAASLGPPRRWRQQPGNEDFYSNDSREIDQSERSSQTGRSSNSDSSTPSFFTSIQNAVARMAFGKSTNNCQERRENENETFANLDGWRRENLPSRSRPQRHGNQRLTSYPLGFPGQPSSPPPSETSSRSPSPSENDPDIERTVHYGNEELKGESDLEYCSITDVRVSNVPFCDIQASSLTIDDPIVDFFRFYYFQGGYRRRFATSGITYQDFLNGSFIKIFDLTSSNEAYNSHLRPALKRGTIYVTTDFDKPTPEEITCLLFTETPATFQIDHNGEVTKAKVQDKLT